MSEIDSNRSCFEMSLPSSTRALIHIGALTIVVGLVPNVASAAWVSNGTRLRQERSADEGYPVPVSVTSDGRGGAYAATGASLFHARLTRIQASGELAAGWPDDGFYYSAGIWWPLNAEVIPDDAGGVYLVANDLVCLGAHCTGNFSWLRVHHVGPGPSHSEGWPAEGLEFGSVSEWNDGERTVSMPSGDGSVLITWGHRQTQDRFPSPRELRVQRVDFDGGQPWGPSGRRIRDFSWRPYEQAVASDGRGGAYVFWLDERAPGLYAQHITANGQVSWAEGGIPIPTAPFTSIDRPVAVSDGGHGALVAWSGTSAGRSGVFAGRVTESGALPWRGRSEVFRAGASPVDELRMAPARAGGAILAWRSRQAAGHDVILAQRIDRAGRSRWRGSGTVACQAQGTRDQLAVASDHRSGAYLAWADSRPEFAIYGMHLNASGKAVQGWPVDGAPICARFTRPTSQGGMAEVTSLKLTSLEPDRAQLDRDDEGDEDESDSNVTNAAVALDLRKAWWPRDEDSGRFSAGAMLVWADDRLKTPGEGIYGYPAAYAMLLMPRGPAAPALAESAGPILIEPTTYSRATPGSSVSTPAIRPLGSDRLRLTLVGDASASLEVFDVSGRRVWSREVGALGGGEHDLRIGDGTPIPSGVYLAKLTQGSHTVRARLLIVH